MTTHDPSKDPEMEPTTFVLTVGIGADAFQDGNLIHELQRILTRVSEQLEGYPLQQEGIIRDRDGNSVGVWGFENPRVWMPRITPDQVEAEEPCDG